jgi:hypothetical protein
MDKFLAIAGTLAAVAVGAKLLQAQIPPARSDKVAGGLKQPGAAPGPAPVPLQTQSTGEVPIQRELKNSRGRSISTDSAGAGITAADLGGS